MANNKVVFGNETIMDITDSTVTPETLKQGEVAYNSAGQRIVGTLVTIGHKILDAFGNLMTNRENLQFQGTYVSDDSTNNKTVVPIVRSMQQAEFEQLSAAEKTGIIDVTDAGFVPTDDERLLDLKDCSIVLPVNGQVLKYNSTTGKWVNANEVSVPEIVDNLTTDDATKTLSAKQGKVLDGKITTINSATVTDSDTVTITVNNVNYDVNFYRYSNGVKQFRVELSNFPTAQFISDAGKIPAKYRPPYNIFCAGMNTNYNVTAAGTNKSRFIALTQDGKIYIYGSPVAGLWLNFFYCT